MVGLHALTVHPVGVDVAHAVHVALGWQGGQQIGYGYSDLSQRGEIWMDIAEGSKEWRITPHSQADVDHVLMSRL